MSSWLIFRPRYLNSTIDQQYAPVSFGTQGGDPLLSQHLLQHADPPPHGRGPHPGKVAGRHQQLCLIGLQWLGRSGPFRPPTAPPPPGARPAPGKGPRPPSATVPHRPPVAWSVRSLPATTRTAPWRAVSVPASILGRHS